LEAGKRKSEKERPGVGREKREENAGTGTGNPKAKKTSKSSNTSDTKHICKTTTRNPKTKHKTHVKSPTNPTRQL
jgi:hypothetical protein